MGRRFKPGARRSQSAKLAHRRGLGIYGYTVYDLTIKLNPADTSFFVRWKEKVQKIKEYVSVLSEIAPDCARTWPSFPMPDRRYQPNAIFSVWHRVGGQLAGVRNPGPTTAGTKRTEPYGKEPVVNESVQSDYEKFAIALFDKYLHPPGSPDYSFSTYLKQNNRSIFYVLGLLELVKNSPDIKELFAWAFLKEEPYATKKFPRTINALSNEIKAVFGPIFRQLDETLFTEGKLSKFFVKKVPVKDRARHIEEVLGTGRVTLADFSSFECCHRGAFARVVFHAFRRLLGDSISQEHLHVLEQLFVGKKYLNFKTMGVEAYVDGTLMSGAPWTSSANAVLNLSILSYLRLRKAHPGVAPELLCEHIDEFVGLIEGDDSITRGGAYCADLLEGLGIPCKVSECADYSRASFCGIVRPLGVEATITDPVKVVCNFFWLPEAMMKCGLSKQMSYLRAKALSYYYQYDTCPVVAWLAYSVLTKTRSYQPDGAHHLSYARNEALREARGAGKFYLRPPVIRPESRELVADLFGITEDEQLVMERTFRDWLIGAPVWLPEPFVIHSRTTELAMADAEWPSAEQKRRSGLVDINAVHRVWYHPASGHVYKKGGKKLPRMSNPMWFDTSYVPNLKEIKLKPRPEDQ